jgi:catechol 2,3-dioxygenase-like lactoylglutathione lyase family enzyme
MRLHHVAVVCRTQENADRFYGTILGLKKIKTQVLEKNFMEALFGEPVACALVLYGNESLALEVFVPESFPDRRRPFVHACLEVKDREEFAMRCEREGLVVKRIPKGNSLVIFVQDFDGNLFEIKEETRKP